MVARAAVYCRISRDANDSGLGVGRQERDCRAWCKKRGWPVAEVLVDNDLSAYSGKRRPAFERMIDGIKAGLFDAIVVWHPDRLTRSTKELEGIIDLVEATGVAVGTVTAGDYDLATPEGRLMARVVGAVARKESEDKSRRIARKHLELAGSGKVSGGGRRPFGYEPDKVTVRKEEAKLVREAARRVLAGESLHGIVADWTARGVGTVTGAPWRVTPFRKMLISPRIAGLREHHGEVVAEAVWPALLDRTTWEEVRTAILGRAPFQQPPRRYLLTGLVRCGACSAATLTALPRPGGIRAYGCSKELGGCGGIRVYAEPVEAHVVKKFLARVPTLKTTVAARSGEDLVAAIEAEERKLAAYASDLDDGTLTRPEWLVLRQRVLARLDGLRAQLAKQSRPRARAALAGRDLAFEWTAVGKDGRSLLSLDEKRALLGLLIDSVVIRRDRQEIFGFDPRRVKIVWAR